MVSIMKTRVAICALLAVMAGSNLAGAEGNGLEAAKKYFDKGEMKAAVIELKNFLQDNPDNVDARALLGEAYLKTGDAAAAAKSLERARDLKAPKEKWLVPLGRAYLAQGDAKSVLEQIRPGEDLSPPIRAEAYGLVGTAYLVKGDLTRAKENLDASLKLNPGSVDALLGMAMLEARQKNFKKSVEYVGQITSKDPKQINAWVVMGEAKRLDGDNAGSIAAFTKAIELQANDARALLGRASSYIEGGKFDEAAKDVATVRKAIGDIPLALFLQATIDFQQKKLDEAQELLSRVATALPDHLPTKLLLGTVAYQKAQYATAENQLSQFLARVPEKHVPAAKLLGATLMKLNRPTDAIRVLAGVEEQGKTDAQFLALLGSAYLQSKELDKGNEYLAKAAALDPKAGAIKAQLGMGQIASGNLDQAVAELKAAVELDQNLSQADVMLVLALLQDKKFDQAIEAANALKAKRKDDPMAENLLGAAYMAKGDTDKAREHWNAALKLKPDYATAALNLAKLELDKKNPEGAKKAFERVLQKDPNNMVALIGLANVAELSKDTDGMEKYLTEAKDKNPKSIDPGVMLAKFYIAHRKPLRAMEVARDLESNHPNEPEALHALAIAQMATDQTQNSLASFKRLVDKAPTNAEYRHQLAQALMKTGDKTAAMEQWRATVKQTPDYLPSYLALAEVLVSERKFDDAQKIADTLKAKQPKSTTGLQLEGDIWLAQREYKKAEAAYDKGFKMLPNGASARGLYFAYKGQDKAEAGFDVLTQWLKTNDKDIDSWVLLGMGRQSVGKWKEAVDAYEKAYALRPDIPVIQNNLAWALQETGDKRALEIADKLLPSAENSPEMMDTVGWIYVNNGRVDKGLLMLQEAALRAPTYPTIRFHVAEALIKAGRKEDARRELEQLLRDNKDFADRTKAENMLKSL